MKKLLVVLALLPTMLFAQNSWINIQYLTDNYPTENSWELLDSYGSVVIESDSNWVLNTLLDTIVPLDAGTYTFNLYDIYGDGLGASAWGGTDGWFLIQNDCQDTLAFVAGDFGSLYTETLIIAPCAPPLAGCTDPIALNYDSLASLDDGSCLFMEGCMNPNASNYDSLAGQLPNGLIVGGGSCNLTIWDQNYFGVDSVDYWNDPSLFAIGNRLYVGLSGQQWFVDHVNFSPNNCNTPAILIYVVPMQSQADGDGATFVPGTNVNAIVGEPWKMDPCVFIYGCTDPNALNYDPTAGVNNGSCINIPGCTDSTAGNYNPAATLDDGSCGGGGAIVCSAGQTLVTVEIMFDQYAGEIGWNIYTTAGALIHDAPQGQFANIQVGQIVTKQICIDDGTEIQFTITDAYGDGLGGAQFGGIDGTWIVYTDCDTISQGMGDFGLTYSEIGTVNQCVVADVFGCTDPAYQEYNSLANVDDGSCLTLIPVSGCTDPGYTEYDPLATVDDGSCMTLIPAGPACGWTLPSPSAYTSFEANPVVILTPPQHPSGAGYFASNQGGGYSCLTPGAVCKDKWAQTVAINSNGWSVGVDVGALDIRNLVTKCNVSTRGIYDSPQGPNMKWHGMGWSVRSIINGSLGHLSPSQPVTAAALNDYAASTAFTNSTTQELWWRWRLPYSSTGYGAVWQDAGQTFPSGVAIGSSNPFAQNYTQTPGITFFVYNELLDFCINYLNMPTPPGSIYNKPDLLTNELQNNGSYGGFALGANSIEVVANELELV